MTPLSPPTGPLATVPTRPGSDAALRQTAQELEATFLAEMLKSAGLGETPSGFGGGAGEDQFASFLRLEQARAIVDAGGIGLAQSLFEAIKVRGDDVV